MSRRPLTDDAPAQVGTETPRDMFLHVLEHYRQSRQDAIHAIAQPLWPGEWIRQWERDELRKLHATCDGWLARYDAAVARAT